MDPADARTTVSEDSFTETPPPRHNTRSRTAESRTRDGSYTEKRKRSPSSCEDGNMSKKSTSDNEPSNALIMRTLNTLSSKFDNLPTVEHLNRLETDLHNKIESNTKALRQELRTEFRAEINEQVTRMTHMLGEIKAQVTTGGASRTNNQTGRYLRARRYFKI